MEAVTQLADAALDRMICGMEKLSREQHEVLVGILLGDANLQTESNGRTYRLRVSQAEQNRDYLFALYEIFKSLVATPPRLDSFLDSKTNKTHRRWVFSTTQQRCLRFYGQQFYGGSKKKVPRMISKWLTPRGFAYWYMDDGSQKWKGRSLGVRLCTGSFSPDETKRLAGVLNEKFGLLTSLQKQRNDLRIYIRSSSYDTLHGILYSHLLSSMLYKFPMRNADQTRDRNSVSN